MATWLFALIVLLIGVGLAYYFDRMKIRPGSGPGEPRQRSERAKWLYFWFAGRFPTKDEQTEDDAARREDGPEDWEEEGKRKRRRK